MWNLAGKTALVTGATGGIGAAIAHSLHAAGANVILTGRRAEVLEAMKAQLGERAHILPADLANVEELEGLLEKAEELAGDIDILVCNAGITRDSLIMRMSNEQWDEVLAVNLTAVFKLNRAAASKMARRRQGRIINITSVIGATGNFGQSNYAAAKAGIVGMSKSIAREVAARNVTVNCVAPGFIKTPMTDGLRPEIKENILTQIPMKRMGSAQDVANVVLFLASEEAGYITGQTLHTNGGMYLA